MISIPEADSGWTRVYEPNQAPQTVLLQLPALDALLKVVPSSSTRAITSAGRVLPFLNLSSFR